ncbi:EF-hand domain-containing family member C2-like [Loxodonta africana]|uniref:EF-hand domain-containing family member C2-like n=1 Tax=Loxodonta africana TaxID=9785 RepID=UPI000C8110E1|nr:EF-hand domain-containing family member C2-like [Loxodonta africana]
MFSYFFDREIMMSITVGKLTDHEVITIARHYRALEDKDPHVNVLITMAHEQLKKNRFENFDRLIATCVYEDREKKNLLPSEDIRRLCKSSSLPVKEDLLVSLLSRFEDSEKQVNYHSFFFALNWRINPMTEWETVLYNTEKIEDVWMGSPSPVPVRYISYMPLLKDVFDLEED